MLLGLRISISYLRFPGMTVVKLKMEANMKYERLQSSNNCYGIKLCKQ